MFGMLNVSSHIMATMICMIDSAIVCLQAHALDKRFFDMLSMFRKLTVYIMIITLLQGEWIATQRHSNGALVNLVSLSAVSKSGRDNHVRVGIKGLWYYSSNGKLYYNHNDSLHGKITIRHVSETLFDIDIAIDANDRNSTMLKGKIKVDASGFYLSMSQTSTRPPHCLPGQKDKVDVFYYQRVLNVSSVP